MSNKLLQDSDGNSSSKRIAGFISGGAGLVLIGVIGVMGIFTEIKDPDTALQAAKTLLYVGGGLLGVGVFEKIGSNK